MASNNEKRDIQINADGTHAINTINKLAQRAGVLRSQIRKLDFADPKREDAINELTSINKSLFEQGKVLRNTASSWDRFKKQAGVIFAGAVGANLATAAIQKLTQFMGGAIESSAELSDAFSDVAKTTDLTNEEVSRLNSLLSEIDTRTSRKELLMLARDAGKLGIKGVENIAAFVKAADQIKIALGEDLGEDAVKQIGKLVNVFELKDKFPIEEAMLKIGSAINKIGASSEASEAFQVEFLSRVGATANTVKIAADEVLGYGAVLDSLNAKVEASSTALNRFFIDFVKNIDEFGKVAGLADGELSTLQRNLGTNEAFIKFLESLNKTSDSSDVLLKKLESLGINGTRGSNTFLLLSQNIDKVKEQQKLANEEFNSGNSIFEEFNKKNENLAARLEKATKKLKAFFRPIQEFIANNYIDFIEWLSKNTELLRALIKLLTVGAASWLAYQIAVKAATLSKKNFIATLLLSNNFLNLQKVALLAAAAAKAIFTGNVTRARAAMHLFNLTTKANPIGLLVSGVTLAITAFSLFNKKTKDASKEVIKLSNSTMKLQQEFNREIEVLARANLEKDQRAKLIDKINSKYKDYLPNLISEKDSIDDIRKAQRLANKEFTNRIILQRYKEDLEELTKRSIDFSEAAAGAEIALADMSARSMQGALDLTPGQIEANKKMLEGMAQSFNEISLQSYLDYEKLENKYRVIAKNMRTDFDKILNNDEKPTISGNDNSANKRNGNANNKEIDETLKLVEMLKKARIDAIDDVEKREIAQLKHSLELEKNRITEMEGSAKVKNALLKQLDENYEEKVDEIKKEAQEKRAEEELNNHQESIEMKYAKEQLLLRENLANNIISQDEYNNKIIISEMAKLEELKALYVEYGQNTIDIENKILDIKQNNAAIEIENIENINRRKLALAQLELERAQSPEEILEAKQEILRLELEQELSNTELLHEEKLLLEEEYQNRLTELTRERNAERLEIASSLVESALMFSQAKSNNEINEIKKRNRFEIDQLDEQLKSKKISEEEYQQKKAAINKKYQDQERKIKREQFVKQKFADTIQAIINTAVAVTEALPNVPLSVATGIAGAAQVSLIQSKEVPEFEKGTILNGPSHPNGGIDIYGKSGKLYGNAEGYETILTKNVALDPIGRTLASDINEYFGGIRFDGAPGPQLLDIKDIISPKQFNLGTVLSKDIPRVNYTNSTIGVNSKEAFYDNLSVLIKKNAEAIERLNSNVSSGITAIIKYEHLREKLDEGEVIENNGVL